jgi:hypothetical protein
LINPPLEFYFYILIEEVHLEKIVSFIINEDDSSFDWINDLELEFCDDVKYTFVSTN